MADTDSDADRESGTPPTPTGVGGGTGADADAGVVRFTRDDGGTLTAHDAATGLARAGRTRAEALSRLAEALADSGGPEPETDPDALREGEGNLRADAVRRVDGDDLPEFL